MMHGKKRQETMTKATVLALAGAMSSMTYSQSQTPIHCEEWHIFASDGAAGDTFGHTDLQNGIPRLRFLLWRKGR